ncbi:MAG: DUF427 domain-containing protein [Actinomycetota bacterium]
MNPASGVAPNGKPYESVWDYPRPPRLEAVEWRIRVIHAGTVVVDAPSALRVLETSQPPAYYVDPSFVDAASLKPSPSNTFCEWKGMASYVDVVAGDRPVIDAGWYYQDPSADYADLVGHYAFYAQRLDECYLDDELVSANDGTFYGGWVTANITGPFKGGPGTAHW